MSDIFVPASLNGADAILAMISQMENLLDVNKRKTLTDDIIKFHSLNDTEKKKYDDAVALIKHHSDILEGTRKNLSLIEEEKNNLEIKKQEFQKQMSDELFKLSEEKKKNKDLFDTAAKLHDEAIETKKHVTLRENDLLNKNLLHEEKIRKYEKDLSILEKQRTDIDEYKKQVIALDNETKAKVEKLKQFNF